MENLTENKINGENFTGNKINNLDLILEQYQNIKTREEEIKKEKEELGNKIKELLKHNENNKYEGNLYKASIVNKTTFKYNDVSGLMQYVVSKGLSDLYLVKQINTTKFNKDLKQKGKLYEDVKGYITEQITESLTVGVK